jgi:hypothetical protein
MPFTDSAESDTLATSCFSWILLDHLNDSSQYEVVAPNIFHHFEFCRIGTVNSVDVLLSIADIGDKSHGVRGTESLDSIN